MMRPNPPLPIFIALLISQITNFVVLGQDVTSDIRLNQIGFFPNASKVAVINSSSATTFEIRSEDLSQTFFSGELGVSAKWVPSGEEVKIADFSSFTKNGRFVLVVSALGRSYPFTIGNNIYEEVNKAAIKAYYFNRASIRLFEQYAGKWARPAGHPDTLVIVHPSAASPSRPSGSVISTPGGWYDAGDYNKYMVTSGISTYTLLSAYENFPTYFDKVNINIPESKNELPDLLDEALWNIRWMLTMQDPEDGGVYHKTTNAEFDDMIMPHKATSSRYVVTKGTAATLNFAAVMACASRVYAPFSSKLPGFRDSCLTAAIKAWGWGQKNPNVTFSNPSGTDQFPAINTGTYGNRDLSDEHIWAAAELYIATKDNSYYERVNLSANFKLPSWLSVGTLGIISLVNQRKNLTPIADTTALMNKLLTFANLYRAHANDTSAYRVPITTGDFDWGSNAINANKGMILLNAYLLTKQESYLKAAISAVDYLLGRNATGYSFVTGFGSKTPMFPHHRPSADDGILEPIPGFLAGGPQNFSKDDGCTFTAFPATSYNDQAKCYTTNEVAINWNAPLVFLLGGLQALNSGSKLVTGASDASEDQLVHFYPNPAADYVNFINNSGIDYSITVRDIYGKEINKGGTIKSYQGSSLNTSGLSNGVYLLEFNNGFKKFLKKLVIAEKR